MGEEGGGGEGGLHCLDQEGCMGHSSYHDELVVEWGEGRRVVEWGEGRRVVEWGRVEGWWNGGRVEWWWNGGKGRRAVEWEKLGVVEWGEGRRVVEWRKRMKKVVIRVKGDGIKRGEWWVEERKE